MDTVPSTPIPFPDIKRSFYQEAGMPNYFHTEKGVPLCYAPKHDGDYLSSIIDEEHGRIRSHLPTLDIDYPVRVTQEQRVWRVRIDSPLASPDAIRTLLDFLTRIELIKPHGSNQVAKLPELEFLRPVEALPSSTPGHFHLYIRKVLSVDAYREFMEALHAAGVIETNFYTLYVRNRRFTMVLRPGITKMIRAKRLIAPFPPE
jgi:hypothetical protein